MSPIHPFQLLSLCVVLVGSENSHRPPLVRISHRRRQRQVQCLQGNQDIGINVRGRRSSRERGRSSA